MQINQCHHLDHSPFCQEANSVSKESIHVRACADYTMTLWTEENCTSSYQTHVIEVVKDMCSN